VGTELVGPKAVIAESCTPWRGFGTFVSAFMCGVVWAAPSDLLKPAPDARIQPFRERLTGLVQENYPQLLIGSFVGTPVLTVLFNPDGTVARSSLQLYPEPSGQLTASEAQFAAFGLHSGELQYVGEARLELSSRTVLVVFGARSSQVLDRELVEQYFPQVATHSVKAGESLWILFDHAGHLLRHGAEAVDPSSFGKALETRYPGIHISDATVASVIGRDDHPVQDSRQHALQLNCLWLTVDSPLPPK
jgi:hypothetical protein